MKRILLVILTALLVLGGKAQEKKSGAGDIPPLVTFTAAQDHEDMMKQLGITELRPGPSGNESDPDHANYDETVANPCPELPDLLKTKKGKKVTTPEIWWKERRPEILEDFEREVYGRLPDRIPEVTWTVKITDREFVGWTPVIAKQLVGRVDNSAYPLIDVEISMMLVVPANAKGPVPVLMMFGRPSFPAPAQPSSEDLEKLNDAFRAMMIAHDPAIKEILDRYPAYTPITRASMANPFAPRGQGSPSPLSNCWLQDGDMPP